MRKIWHQLFLMERPSIGLAFFRIFVALGVGAHLIPAFFHLPDTFFVTAFKTYNTQFFPIWFIEWVQQSPDGLVLVLVWVFLISWMMFLLGWFTQISGWVMMGCCYYFYALNTFALAESLAWDILLVTLFLMICTPYPGDYFSIDCLRRQDQMAYRRQRPFFIQRLLQMQIGFVYFYTALYKVTAEGNWITDNPIYYLLNYPHEGVTKYFMLRDFMAARPEWCYALGIFIVVMEMAMIFLLFIPRTRVSGIYWGVIFHIMLMLTLDVPAIFFFVFPPQLLLFINPEHIAGWIDQKRHFYERLPDSMTYRLVYDGRCHFCRQSVARLAVMDLLGRLRFIDYHGVQDPQALHPLLTTQKVRSQIHLLDPQGRLNGGFFAFRRLGLILPMMMPWLPVLYFPGMGVVGPVVYQWVAKNRYIWHRHQVCRDNMCFYGKGS
jgi:predicted DCC family thiol-disulfide oxidoreductase YuxK